MKLIATRKTEGGNAFHFRFITLLAFGGYLGFNVYTLIKRISLNGDSGRLDLHSNGILVLGVLETIAGLFGLINRNIRTFRRFSFSVHNVLRIAVG